MGVFRNIGEGLGLVTPDAFTVGAEQLRGAQTNLGAIRGFDEAFQLDPRLAGAQGLGAQGFGATGSSLNLLQQAATGQVPSAAEIQQRQGLQDAISGQAALAAGAAGPQQAAAQRAAAEQAAGLQQGVINQGAALRAEEQALARGQLAQTGLAAGAQGLQADQLRAGLAQDRVNQILGLAGANQAAKAGAKQSQMAALGSTIGAAGTIGGGFASRG